MTLIHKTDTSSWFKPATVTLIITQHLLQFLKSVTGVVITEHYLPSNQASCASLRSNCECSLVIAHFLHNMVSLLISGLLTDKQLPPDKQLLARSSRRPYHLITAWITKLVKCVK